MAKFCNQCGRPLEEGETCNCQIQEGFTQSFQGQQGTQQNAQTSEGNSTLNQMNQQFAGKTKNLFEKILPLCKNPVGEIKNLAMSNDKSLGLIMVLCNIVISILITIIGMIVVRVKLGQYAEYISIPYVKMIISVGILVAANYFALAGFLLLTSKVFFKAETNFAQMISVIGVKALYDTFIMIIGTVVSLVFPAIGIFLILLGGIYTMVVMLFSYGEVVNMNPNNKVYSICISYVGMLLMYYIIYKSVFDNMLSNLSNYSSFF